ncbi:unnamed protein product [Dovyalis caffra]|uniref:Uncharacterized protein n=1 Tax=Dovyalis caffra TaxID=77055 RepID=A0AAV1RT74_9ROSI|nr:unnamed protein product [Dovyalis caffra]
MRASRARKLLQKKEEQRAADKAAGIYLHSDYSDDESLELPLGFRLQNKHQCLAQGLAFLYNNLQQTENSVDDLEGYKNDFIVTNFTFYLLDAYCQKGLWIYRLQVAVVVGSVVEDMTTTVGEQKHERINSTDSELACHYLYNKVMGFPLSCPHIVQDYDLYGQEEPWQVWDKFGGSNNDEDDDGAGPSTLDLFFFTTMKGSNCAGKARASMLPKHHNEASTFDAHSATCNDSPCAGKARASTLPKHHNEASTFEAHSATYRISQDLIVEGMLIVSNCAQLGDDGAASSCLLQETDFDGGSFDVEDCNSVLSMLQASAKGMLQEFVNTILPLVRESIYVKTLRRKVKKRLTISVLRERISILNVQENDDVFGEVRPLASKSDLLTSERRSLVWRQQEYCNSSPTGKVTRDDKGVFTVYLNDSEARKHLLNHRLVDKFIDGINERLFSDKLPGEKEEELQSLLARNLWGLTEADFFGFDYVRSAIQKQPHSIAGWNCYYKIASLPQVSGFILNVKQDAGKFVEYGIMKCHHQDAAREYLEAYKLMPECPLINLCVGTALINLTLGFRLQNKHHCLAQGLTFIIIYREAAYNLHLIYKNSGAFGLARQDYGFTGYR